MKIIKESWKTILIALIITFGGFLIGFENTKASEPGIYFHVYLDGESIGLIKSKTELENYIDEEQKEIKEKYSVDKVYSPKEIVIEKEITFEENILSAKEVYETIQELSSFTVDGYEMIVNQEEKEIMHEEELRAASATILYATDDTFLKNAVDTIAKIFIGEDDFVNFENETQEEIDGLGSIIESIYLEEKITIEKTRIPTDELIFVDEESLTKYLLYGTLEEQKKYTIKLGDTIATVAFNNNLSADEFLVANPIFTNVDNILFPGQKVAIGLIKPKISIVAEKTSIETQINKYQTTNEYDENLNVGSGYEKQKGQDGENKVTKKVKYINGKIETAIITNTEELVPKIDRVYVKGGRTLPNVGGEDWYWPTITPYVISSPYGPRWGTFHRGVDISGCGYGSPIFAANNGTVETAGYNSISGYNVKLDHNNGYKTRYVHLSKYYVSPGQNVKKGQIIAAMGSTGYSTGTHLHFEIWYNGSHYNPRSFY